MTKKKPADTRLSPAERTAKLLAFKGASHNFGCANVKKAVPIVASNWMKTA